MALPVEIASGTIARLAAPSRSGFCSCRPRPLAGPQGARGRSSTVPMPAVDFACCPAYLRRLDFLRDQRATADGQPSVCAALKGGTMEKGNKSWTLESKAERR
jgi:hypothetical protein